MGALSRSSGADGEREVAKLFREYGYPAERGCQHDGRTGHADVIGVPGLFIEVKFHATFTRRDLEKAFAQVERDSNAKADENGLLDIIPVVVWKKKREHGWNVSLKTISVLDLMMIPPFSTDTPLEGIHTMYFDEFVALYQAFERAQR